MCECVFCFKGEHFLLYEGSVDALLRVYSLAAQLARICVGCFVINGHI